MDRKRTLRGGFKKDLDVKAREYTASISFDRRLYRQDIAGSIAHATMLAKQGIISEGEAGALVAGLESIRADIERGEFEFRNELEDIHLNIESALFERAGDVAGKLHTARSRNDQVALDMRLFVKEAITGVVHGLKGLQRALVKFAEDNQDVIIPGYTHLQRAQLVLLAHHVMAYFEMFERDIERFQDCYRRTDVMPLGSGALAGVPYHIDRDFVARELGFSKISANSMDAVSDRDFVLEFECASSIAMMHLSRLAEELVLWSSSEFGFVIIDDAFMTGSSIMPQKKNPDVAELARGKTGRIYGNLMGFLTTMKGLPLTYNRDMQEDKESLFDTVDTLSATIGVFTGIVETMKVDAECVQEACDSGYLLATDIADYLVSKGLPFREAHFAVSRLITYVADKGKDLRELTLAEYRKFCPAFDTDVYDIKTGASVASRTVPGGTAPEQVKAAISRAKRLLRTTK